MRGASYRAPTVSRLKGVCSMSVSQHDWSLHRKGQADQERHKEKIREAIKKNLGDIVSEESIILSDGKKMVRVPIRSLDEYRFRYDPGRQQHAGKGEGKVKDIKSEALRYKVWEPTIRYQSNAVVIAMMDVSGSMGEFEKYIARSFYFWMVRFLRTKYNNVQIVFISHHTEAKEVTEEEFFHKGESGGTQVSSAYELALEIIRERYNPDDWNIYPFHFSDGDNLPWDNDRCVQLVTRLMELCNIFGYGEIREGHYRSPSTLMSAYNKISDSKFTAVTISDKKEVYPALRKFFAQRDPISTR